MRPEDSDNSGSADGNIKVWPGTWTDASHTVSFGNQKNEDIQAAVMLALNGVIDALNAFSFLQGAVNLANALSDFSDNLGLSLGCVAVDLSVVASGLLGAAQAFAGQDQTLANMWADLQKQLPYFTTGTTLTPTVVSTFSPLTIHPAYQPDPISSFFSQAWHTVTSWASDAHDWVYSHVSSAGAPPWAASATAALAAGVVFVGVLILAPKPGLL
ncbi:hypothetical protein [Thermogemmatispora carboxidivorans]|uniref:hypothetical protein n=1 Tax=Thermogemmatispora carboxidivorans TaxID=1382306 RepID=UPI000699B5A4|nr:hypothetical protein [Thermogemmatispora carboxidivorans]